MRELRDALPVGQRKRKAALFEDIQGMGSDSDSDPGLDDEPEAKRRQAVSTLRRSAVAANVAMARLLLSSKRMAADAEIARNALAAAQASHSRLGANASMRKYAALLAELLRQSTELAAVADAEYDSATRALDKVLKLGASYEYGDAASLALDAVRQGASSAYERAKIAADTASQARELGRQIKTEYRAQAYSSASSADDINTYKSLEAVVYVNALALKHAQDSAAAAKMVVQATSEASFRAVRATDAFDDARLMDAGPAYA